MTRILAARTVDVSAGGARIKDFSGTVAVGQSITIVYRERQCAYRVVWIGAPGLPWAGHVGMESLEKGKNIWNMEFRENCGPSFDFLDSLWEVPEAS